MTAFLRPRPVTSPSVRLVAFHHAGGSASVYFPLVRALPADWDLLLYDLPGRGRRFSEPALRQIDAVVERVARDLDNWLEEPFVLFGHSLGAIVAGEFARHCAVSGRPPAWLGVSGRQSPAAPPRLNQRLHELDDAALLDTLLGLGGTHAKVLEDPDFLKLFLTIARADLEAVETYRPMPPRGGASYPVTAFAGHDDPWAPPASMRSWAEESAGPFSLVEFGGGHFHFLGKAFPAFAAAIVKEISTRLHAQYADRGSPIPAHVIA